MPQIIAPAERYFIRKILKTFQYTASRSFLFFLLILNQYELFNYTVEHIHIHTYQRVIYEDYTKNTIPDKKNISLSLPPVIYS